jgi:hypothetical protein
VADPGRCAVTAVAGRLLLALRGLGLAVDEQPDLAGGAYAAFSPCTRHGAETVVDAGGKCALCGERLRYRYVLGREWGPGPPAVFIMLNPSTADAYVLDPTVRRCVGFARQWGAGGLVVLNAFALRSTDPRALRVEPDPTGPANDRAIAAVLADRRRLLREWEAAGEPAPMPTVVAWGVHATLGRRDEKVLALLREHRFAPMRLGNSTKDGHPRHPLYVPGNVEPTPHRLLLCVDDEGGQFSDHDWSHWTGRPADIPPGSVTRLRYCGRCNLYQGERAA